MLLKYFYDRPLAQASYLVGCSRSGEALVIDPARDINPYLRAAEVEGLRIAHVAETHIHADFVSGGRELAARTGARLYLSDLGGPDWRYGDLAADQRRLTDGDSWWVGRVRVEALATPGHTPEHIVLQVTDTAAAAAPMGLFSGDCLFVGTVGRPDLLEVAAGFQGTKTAGARQQFHSVGRLRALPDYLQIWPGHGAGSACGKGLGAVPSTTLGYEKRFNPAFQFNNEAAFVAWLLEGQPEAPRYFARMKQVNRSGPALLADLAPLRHLTDPHLFARLLDEALVLDTRPAAAFAARHALGTVNVPLDSLSFSTYAGWYVDYAAPTYLIVEAGHLEAALRDLRAIGVDDIPGYFTPDILADYAMRIWQVTPAEASDLLRRGAALLDVRSAEEYRAERIPGARHIPMGYVRDHLAELPLEDGLIVQCGGGTRSQIVASLLQREGFMNVVNLSGGIDGWKRAGLPVDSGPA